MNVVSRYGAVAVTGVVVSPTGGSVPGLSTRLSLADRLGALRMRLNIGRRSYRVDPGLYRVGEPTPASPVLVTANYKLTVDQVRSSLDRLDVWLLVLDTAGINVWCAAGKNKLTTVGLCRQVVEAGLAEVVAHRTLVLPQLAAPGVAAHDVRAFTGFRVVYGPVRARDIRAFLAAGMKATPQMREVTFTLPERLVLTGVELSLGLRLRTLGILAAIMAASGIGIWGFATRAMLLRGMVALFAAYSGLLTGAFAMPALLPWLPFRMFAAKGLLLGAIAGAGLAWAMYPAIGALAAAGAAFATAAIASCTAMNFTGSSPFTSMSGVEREMRRMLPWQIGLAAAAILLWVTSAFIGRRF